jgi:hypothetical protein
VVEGGDGAFGIRRGGIGYLEEERRAARAVVIAGGDETVELQHNEKARTLRISSEVKA